MHVKSARTSSLLAMAVCYFAAASPAAASETTRAVERPVQDTVVVGIWGNRQLLRDYVEEDSRALVCVFLGVECPLARLYMPTLNRLEDEFRIPGVKFLGVYPNPADTVLEIASHAQETGMVFPAVKDDEGRLAKILGATRTPEVFVLNKTFDIQYRGQINDQYQPGRRKEKAARDYLADALNKVMAGEPVEVARTLGLGCRIESSAPLEIDEQVTFYEHVLPILQRRCQTCHREGEVAPFSLLTYEQARSHQTMIGEVIRHGRMPPWGAVMNEASFGPLRDHRRMERREARTVLTWLEQGALEGEKTNAPPPREWPAGWAMGEPDLVIKMPQPFAVPADGELGYEFFTVPGFKEDRWVQAVEMRAGEPAVVHHAHLHVTSPRRSRLFGMLGMLQLYGVDGSKARVLGSYLPGCPPVTLPEGYAMRIPAGYNLTFELHYTPNGTPTADQTSVAFKFADGPPKFVLHNRFVLRKGFTVPAGEPMYREECEFTFKRKSRLFDVTPHLHKRGKHWRFEIEYPDGKVEHLLSVPQWDFDWQYVYTFQRPIDLPAMTKIRAIGIWDNTSSNPNNPDPTIDVPFGLLSKDEMMVARYTYTVLPETDESPRPNPRQGVAGRRE